MMRRETAMANSMETQAVKSASNRGKIVVALLFAAAIGVFFYFDLGRYLTFDALKANRDNLLAYAESNYAVSVTSFIVIYCLVVALSLPGAAIMTLAGGFLFGPLLGTVYVNLGATTGATVAFLVARYLLHDWVEAKFGNTLNPIQDGISKNAFSYLFTARLIPFVPFFVINLVSGLTRISLATFVAATTIGIIPASFVFAYAGRQLGTINSPKEVLSPPVLLAFGLLILLALVPIFYQRWTTNKAGVPSQ